MNRKQIITHLKAQIVRLESIIQSCNLEAARRVYEIELNTYKDLLWRIK